MNPTARGMAHMAHVRDNRSVKRMIQAESTEKETTLMTGTYTIEELKQAMSELNAYFIGDASLAKIAEQADKNRIVRENSKYALPKNIEDIRNSIREAGFTATEHNIPEFTEEQVRTALAGALFIDEMITRLRPPESYEEGAVYRSRLNTVWQRSGGNWLKPGESYRYPDHFPARPLVKI